jgi:hypothetical protein
MNDREFSDIEIFQNSGKGLPLFVTGHKNCLQADYLLGPGPRLIKKRIYRAAVSQRLRNTAVGVLSEGVSLYVCRSWKVFSHLCQLFLLPPPLLLGAFAKLQKSDYWFRRVSPSVHPSALEQLGSNWTDFHENLYLSIFEKKNSRENSGLTFRHRASYI